jgi:hypothetical protein
VWFRDLNFVIHKGHEGSPRNLLIAALRFSFPSR